MEAICHSCIKLTYTRPCLLQSNIGGKPRCSKRELALLRVVRRTVVFLPSDLIAGNGVSRTTGNTVVVRQ
jgi:hypothetical protein